MTNINEHGPLITVEALDKHVNDPQWVVIDCRFNLMKPSAGRQAYLDGHIPGACYADLDCELAGPVSATGGGRHPLPDPTILSALFVDWGVSADSTVVVYDDLAGAVASRLWWLMRWMGHERVSLLDGGLQAWTGAGLALSVDAPADRCGTFEGRPGSMPVIDVEAVLSGLDKQSLIRLDARDPDRFLGRAEPIDAVAGHIPGAQNASFKNNIGADRRFRDADTLREYYLPLKGEVISMSDVACMCGSGVTACHTLLALEQAGLSGAALYVGSWSDWISDPQRPVARDDA